MLTKEHGSSIEYDPNGCAACLPQERPIAGRIRLYGTARQALIALVRTLHRMKDVRQILLPDHYC